MDEVRYEAWYWLLTSSSSRDTGIIVVAIKKVAVKVTTWSTWSTWSRQDDQVGTK